MNESEQNISRITLVVGRRNVSLRDLMQLEIVKQGNLRVEEAVQAHQYTGPMFEVLVFAQEMFRWLTFRFDCRYGTTVSSATCLLLGRRQPREGEIKAQLHHHSQNNFTPRPF